MQYEIGYILAYKRLHLIVLLWAGGMNNAHQKRTFITFSSLGQEEEMSGCNGKVVKK